MISGAIVWTWLLCFRALLVAQVTTATISGTVSDQSGAVIPGVTIIVTNVDTGRSRIAETNEQGRYRVRELLVGA
ncbi:MAG: carboxypeptidase regulatory-like domain-containing protein [Proteobacteria bacterium]|nr:carboxypeptidase regulatory-like domain-containing protein [Pseudomonadota bacterium]